MDHTNLHNETFYNNSNFILIFIPGGISHYSNYPRNTHYTNCPKCIPILTQKNTNYCNLALHRSAGHKIWFHKDNRFLLLLFYCQGKDNWHHCFTERGNNCLYRGNNQCQRLPPLQNYFMS